MSSVFVVDTNRQALNPIHPGRARILLKQGRAAVLKRSPFTLVLHTQQEATSRTHGTLRLKLDPGSKTTGLAIINDVSGEVVFAAELSHRGQAITLALSDRRAVRRARRQRHTRYRKPRFNNRRRKAGWLAPCLESRVHNLLTWVNRLRRVCPITALSLELVKFDTQAMENPQIAGTDYQQGTLAGYEIREYLLQKWKRQCAYYGKSNVPLQVEHLHPRAHGGTNRVSNLAIACQACNIAKGMLDLNVFLAKKPDILKRIQAQAKAPLKDAAAVNTTRWVLFERLKSTGLPIECGSGGLTKLNRTTRGIEKSHWGNAANVGKSTPVSLDIQGVVPLLIKAVGHGRRQMCVTDAFGFPKQHKARHKRFLGYQTGDICTAVISSGKYKGTYTGRIAIRHRPSFRLGKIDVHPKHLRCVQHADGYEYILKGGGNSSHS
jgi:5-methylcytosine-specific restriction endonuclease McrA